MYIFYAKQETKNINIAYNIATTKATEGGIISNEIFKTTQNQHGSSNSNNQIDRKIDRSIRE